MAKASDNVFPKLITGVQTTDISAPTDGSWKLYSKPGGIYARSSNSVVGPFAAASAASYVTGELDYVQITSPVTITQTAEASATTCITGSAIAYDGSTVIYVEVFAPYIHTPPNSQTNVWLFDGSSSIGQMALYLDQQASADQYHPLFAVRRLTPSAATHTYSIRMTRTNTTTEMGAGAGGSGNYMPAYIRITRA